MTTEIAAVVRAKLNNFEDISADDIGGMLAELDRVTGERDELEVNQRSKNIYHLVAKRDQLQLERDNAINIAHRAKNDLQTECDKNIELQAYLDAAPNVDELLRTMDEQDALDACSLYYINRPGAKEAG